MPEDTNKLTTALMTTAAQMRVYVNNPPYSIAGEAIVPLTPKSCQALAQLMERAAAALIEEKQNQTIALIASLTAERNELEAKYAALLKDHMEQP